MIDPPPYPASTRVGIDLVEVRQVEESMRTFGERYVRRLFTEAEIAYAERDAAHTAQRLAARFAAKEATLKVLRPVRRWVDWRAIEVVRTAFGACGLALHGEAAALARRGGISGLSVSLSHEPTYATAVVIGELGAGRACSTRTGTPRARRRGGSGF